MLRSKIIPIAFALFCGLALQFQTNAAKAQSATLFPGGNLYAGLALRSYNGHTLVNQQDGNVVLYNRNNIAIWASNTQGASLGYFFMQTDGNLVLYDGNHVARWASGTAGNPGAFLNIQDDGNMVIYRYGSQSETPNNALWASGTSGQ